MKFNPEDFGYVDGNHDHDSIECVDAAKIANAKLEAWLKDAQELVKFTKQYGFNPYPETITIIPYIDWDLVRKAFSGILISPYIDESRFTLHWYYGWDCASACVWDLSTVKEIVGK